MKFYYRGYKTSSLAPILIHLNRIHPLPSHVVNIN